MPPARFSFRCRLVTGELSPAGAVPAGEFIFQEYINVCTWYNQSNAAGKGCPKYIVKLAHLVRLPVLSGRFLLELRNECDQSKKRCKLFCCK